VQEVSSSRWNSRAKDSWQHVGRAGNRAWRDGHLPRGADRREERVVTLRHLGFASREMCSAFAIGWETSLERLRGNPRSGVLTESSAGTCIVGRPGDDT